MTTKPKFPRADAIAAAREILQCFIADRVIIAGSLRRRKPFVGDIEILYIPKLDTFPDPDDLLRERSITRNLSDLSITDVMIRQLRILRPRENVLGATTWGVKNKLAIHIASGIPVDFFATTACAWSNYLVCRTGPAENNVRIATAAQNKGWKWHPYAQGFTNATGRLVPVHSEHDVFTLVDLPYLEPWER